MIQLQANFTEWIGQHLFTCPFKQHFGFDCPGCGFQRSVLALLKGDFILSFKLYPATIPLICLVVFTLLHLKTNFQFGAKAIKIAFSFIAVLVLINYIYKIYTHQLYA